MKILLLSLLVLSSCSSFKAKRVDAKESDEKALEITDKWVQEDNVQAVRQILKQMRGHRGYMRYMSRKKGEAPKVFISEVQNTTSEPYFPIDDLNDEFLNEISATGEFTLIDAAARERLLKELTYQHDGMVDPKTVKQVGKQTGADLLIFGTVFMRPHSRKGKTIKEYTVNIRMTDLETGVEVLRTRAKVNKYSEQSSSGW